jgi:hypothetical protein
MPDKDQNDEALHSIHSRSGDINRFVLFAAMKGSISDDRKRDIVRAAQDIIAAAGRLK